MTVPDEEVFAFVDGELPPEAMARIEAAMATDPQLALRIETQRALRRLLAGPHAGLVETPAPAAPETLQPDPKSASPSAPPPALKAAEVIAFPGAKAKEKAKEKAKPKAKPREPKVPRSPGASAVRRPPAWMLMIACLVGGMFIGRVAVPPPPIVSGADDASRLAAGPLARALNAARSGQAAGPVSIGESFRNGAGAYCRTFLAAGQETVSGVACREGAAWRVRAILPAAPQNPAAVQAVVAAMMVGRPLGAADEARALAAGWKPSKGAAPRKD